MANRGLGTLTVSLVAEIGGFVAGMDKAERQTKKRLAAIEKEASRAGKAIGIAFAAAAVAVGAGLSRAIDAADSINDMAIRTGVSTEALSRLEVAAKLTDTSLESLQNGFIKLARSQQDALAGGEAQQQAFAKLGVSLEELATLDPEQLLGAVADGIKSIEDPALQTSAAAAVLGKGVADLLPLLKEGSAGFAEYGRVADDLGITLSQDAATAAADFNDQIDLMTLGMDGAFRKAAVDLLPTITELATEINSPEFREGFSTIVSGATTAAGALAKLAVEVATFTKNLGEGFAVAFNGIGGDDISRLEEEANRLRAKQADLADNFVLLDIGGAAEKVDQQLNSVEAKISDFYQRQASAGADRLRKLAEGVPLPGGTGTTPGDMVINPDMADAAEFGIAPRGGGGRSKESAERTESLGEYIQALKGVADEENAQRDRWNAMVASLNGPLAEAQFDHETRLKSIRHAGEEAGASSASIARAVDLETAAHERNVEAINASLNPLDQLLADMDFELDLLGKTNAERVTELELRRLGIELGSEEAAAAAERIRARVEEYEAMQEQISAMDDFRSSFEDNVAGVLDGSKSISDALKDMVNDFIAQLARLAAQNFTEQLFGQMGSGDTGAAGGWISSLFGAFTARASGGPISSGVPYLVGEHGPELVIPNAGGTVIPAGKTAQMLGGPRGGDTFNILGSTSRRATERIQIQQGRNQRRATAEFA